jgi:hypothetical protein
MHEQYDGQVGISNQFIDQDDVQVTHQLESININKEISNFHDPNILGLFFPRQQF